MPPALTDLLCTRCGLCCDGSLFGDVELRGEREAVGLEILGLDVADDGDDFALLQPCAGLDGRRCRVYAHRPRCCRTFECRLLMEARAGCVSVARARARIRETRARIRRLERLLGRPRGPERLALKERCEEALTRERGEGARALARSARIRAAWRAVASASTRWFLGVPAGRST